MGITKTDFMRGMQCRKMLWLDKHKPSLKVIPPEVQQRLDAGNDFGDRAMAMFGDYEEMTVYRPGTTLEYLTPELLSTCPQSSYRQLGSFCGAERRFAN